MTEAISGSEPAAYVRHEARIIYKDDVEPRSMFSEIEDGIFVAWSTCAKCMTNVGLCTCPGGPQEPAYITRWRHGRFENSLRQRPVPDVSDRKVLSQVVEAIQQYGFTVVGYEAPPKPSTPVETHVRPVPASVGEILNDEVDVEVAAKAPWPTPVDAQPCIDAGQHLIAQRHSRPECLVPEEDQPDSQLGNDPWGVDF